MAENSKIEWTDHTLNFWWGCVKVSPGCEHCYAEAFSKRVGRNIWGPAKTTERWRTKSPWRDVIKWNAKAQAEGVRRKVLCQSMSDFFEDHPQVAPWRAEACEILESLTWLDIQLLTKRIENVLDMVPAWWRNVGRWPAHVWIGTSVEDQQRADERIPHLLRIPARVRFLSMEPLLGPVDLSAYLPEWCLDCDDYILIHREEGAALHEEPEIDWVIVGGESGHSARPMHPDWARSLRDQCVDAGVPFHFKQWGEWAPYLVANRNGSKHFWPDGGASEKVGKHAAGRLLDGREWNESPQ